MQHCLYRSVGGIYDYLFLNASQFASVIQPHLVTHLLILCRYMLRDANHDYVLYSQVRKQGSCPKEFTHVIPSGSAL